MNQGKSEVDKQEMARMNTEILGISELKWTRIVKFNSDNNYIHTTMGKNPLKEMEQPSQSTKESKMQCLGAISKRTE